MSNPFLEILKTLEGKTLEGAPAPVTGWLKGVLLKVEAGKAVMQYTVRHEMTNPLKTLQGGIFTVMMDDALGVAVYSLGKDRFYTTVNFTIDYLESASEGDLVTITAGVIREGNTILNIAMKAEDTSGKLLATATSNLVAKDIPGWRLPEFKRQNLKLRM